MAKKPKRTPLERATERARVSFTVYGTPVGQGSKRAIMGPNQRFPSIIESAGAKLKLWRSLIAHAAGQATGQATQGKLMSGPVTVDAIFYFARPKSHYGSGKNSERLKDSAPFNHVTKPDIDKLSRALLDGLTSRVYRDDSQVYSLNVEKEYTDEQPRVEVLVMQGS